jgi:hypothetical protein
MDKYDYEQTDKQMSKKINAIYSDPKRHKFVSQFDMYCHERGPRGGLLRLRKTICGHCGNKKNNHADEDEKL